MAEVGGMESMDDFMELVTAYRCKFCDFTATTPQAISQHVKQQHIKTSLQQVSGPKTATIFRSVQPATAVESVQVSLQEPTTHRITMPSLKQAPELETRVTKIAPVTTPMLMSVDALSSVIQQADLGLPVGTDKPSDMTDDVGNQLMELVSGTGSPNQVYTKSLLSSVSGQSTSVQQLLSSGTIVSDTGGVEMLTEHDQLQNEVLNEVGGEPGSLSNIQFVNEDSQGQLVAANCGHVQLGDGSTVQVLVYDSNLPPGLQTQTGPQLAIQQAGNQSVSAVQVEEEEGDKMAVDCEAGGEEAGLDGHHGNMTDTGSGQLEFVVDDQASEFIQQNKEQDTNEDNQGLDPVTQDASSATGQLPEEGDPQTKELYLCGSCCEGFSSIQTCKEHMIRDHGLTSNEASQVSSGTGSGRVDAGTQMEPRKKAGRKKKSELAKKEEEEKEEEVVIALSDSDEDWSEQLFSYSSRSQRKRRPPAALRNDYYLGRSRVKSPKRRGLGETGPLVKCEWKGCTIKFRSEEAMRHHLDCHIEGAANNEPQFRCLDCEERFQVWKPARHHMWKIHKIEMDLYACEVCSFKTDALSKLKIHCEVHGEERPYHCEICGKGFKQFAQMKNHEHCHDTGVDPDHAHRWHTPKVCDVCDRTFANAKCLKKHREIVHGNQKPFQCPYCDHTCARKAMLVLHQRIHTGEKPFKCDRCSYSCGDHNSLRRHKMRHSGHRPYKCPHCPYACIQAISLKVHVKNKHPGLGGIHNCHLCLYRTVNKQQYENHLLDHKNGLIETIVAPDGQVQYKNVNHTRKLRAGAVVAVKPEVTTLALQPSLLESLNTQTVQMASMLQPQVIEIPMATPGPNTEQVGQLEMQVQMNEAGQNIISADDLAKLTNYDGTVQSDVQAAQLIYSALSAISQNNGSAGGGTGGVAGGGATAVVSGNQEVNSQGEVVPGVDTGNMQTTIQTNSKEGVTTHTITFHLPEGEEMAGGAGNIVAGQQVGQTGGIVAQQAGGGGSIVTLQTTGQGGGENKDNTGMTILKMDQNGTTTTWPANTVFLDQTEIQNC